MRRNCPVCECSSSDVIFDNQMTPVDNLDMSYSIGRCADCGFYFANDLPDNGVYSQYYENLSKYDGLVASNSIDLERVACIGEFCEIHLGKDVVILDVGCGSGLLLAELKRRGWSNLIGIDPAPNATTTANQLFGLTEIHSGTLANAHELVDLKKVDVVCLMAVLEHLPRLREDLQSILSKVKIGCKVLVEVPAIPRFNGYSGEPYGEFSLEHIQYFTSRSLRNLLVAVGAEALDVEIMKLSVEDGGDLLGLFECVGKSSPIDAKVDMDALSFSRYISDSEQRFCGLLDRIPRGAIIVYGAGSHSARLLRKLESVDEVSILAVVDGNSNLIGKSIGQWTIQSPEFLLLYPDIPIVISSYRAQNAIILDLKKAVKNPIVVLY